MLSRLQLCQNIFIGLPVVFHLWVMSISVFSCQVCWVQYWVWLPSLTVSISTSLLPATCLCWHLCCLDILVCLSLGWASIFLRTYICGFCCAEPLISLSKNIFTSHPGWALWISVFPYLWLEAFFDLSTKASFVMLKPVVARPDLFKLTSGLLKTYFVFAVKVLAWRLSALSFGTNPW